MATYTAEQAKPYWPIINETIAGGLRAVRGVYVLSGALALNDIIQMCVLPAQHVLVDCILDTDDLDTNGTPTISLSVGVPGVANALISSSTVGRTGGVARLDQVAGLRLTASDNDTVVQITVSATPATSATTGTIGLTLLYRPVQGNE